MLSQSLSTCQVCVSEACILDIKAWCFTHKNSQVHSHVQVVVACSLHEKHAEGSVLMFVIAMPNKLQRFTKL